MFKCKTCGKEFPVVAWIETATTTYPNFAWQGTNCPPSNSITFDVTTNWQSTTTFKKPICPYCQSTELEEVK
jgi:transposase-like protein